MAKIYPQMSAVRAWNRNTVADGLTFQLETIRPLTNNIKAIWTYLKEQGIEDLSNVSASAMSAASAFEYIKDWMPDNEKGNPTISDIQASADKGMSAWMYCSADHYFVGLENSAISGCKAWEKLSGYMDPDKPSYLGKIKTSAEYGADAWDHLRDYDLAGVNKSAYSSFHAITVLTANQKTIEYLFDNDAVFRNLAASSEEVYKTLYGTNPTKFANWVAYSTLINASADRMNNAVKLVNENSANWNELDNAHTSAINQWNPAFSYTDASATGLDKITKYVADSAANWTTAWHYIYDTAPDYAPSSFAEIWNGMATKDTTWWLTWLCQDGLANKHKNWNTAYTTMNANKLTTEDGTVLNLADSVSNTYNTVLAKSGDWNKVKAYDYAALDSTNWNKTWNTVNAGSGEWKLGYNGWNIAGQLIASETEPFMAAGMSAKLNNAVNSISGTSTKLTVPGKNPTRWHDAYNALAASADLLSDMYDTVAENSGLAPSYTEPVGLPRWEQMIPPTMGQIRFMWMAVAGTDTSNWATNLPKLDYAKYNEAVTSMYTKYPSDFSDLIDQTYAYTNTVKSWDDGVVTKPIIDWWSKWLAKSDKVKSMPANNARLTAFEHVDAMPGFDDYTIYVWG